MGLFLLPSRYVIACLFFLYLSLSWTIVILLFGFPSTLFSSGLRLSSNLALNFTWDKEVYVFGFYQLLFVDGQKLLGNVPQEGVLREILLRLLVLRHEVVPPAAKDDLVVNIRHVHLKEDLVRKVVLHDPSHDVHRQVGARVSHVADVVHGGAARVPEHAVPHARDEELLLTGQRVDHTQPRDSLLRRTHWSVP